MPQELEQEAQETQDQEMQETGETQGEDTLGSLEASESQAEETDAAGSEEGSSEAETGEDTAEDAAAAAAAVIDPESLTPEQRIEGALRYFPEDAREDIKAAMTLAESISDPDKGLGFIPTADEIIQWKGAVEEAVDMFNSLGAGSDKTLAYMMVARDPKGNPQFTKEGKVGRLSQDGVGIINAIGSVLPNIPVDAQQFVIRGVTVPHMEASRSEIIKLQTAADRISDKDSDEWAVAKNAVLDEAASFNALRKLSGLAPVSVDDLIDPKWSDSKEPTEQEREVERLRKELEARERKQSQRPVEVLGRLIDQKAAENLTALGTKLAADLNITLDGGSKTITSLIEKALADISKRPALEKDLKSLARRAAVQNDKNSLQLYLSRLASAVKPYLRNHLTQHQRAVVEAQTKAAGKKVVKGQARETMAKKTTAPTQGTGATVKPASGAPAKSFKQSKAPSSPYDLLRDL